MDQRPVPGENRGRLHLEQSPWPTACGRDGWRAQLARPVAIVRGSESERQVRGVADQLGIPAVRSRDIERVAVEFGRQRLALASPTRVRLDV